MSLFRVARFMGFQVGAVEILGSELESIRNIHRSAAGRTEYTQCFPQKI